MPAIAPNRNCTPPNQTGLLTCSEAMLWNSLTLGLQGPCHSTPMLLVGWRGETPRDQTSLGRMSSFISHKTNPDKSLRPALLVCKFLGHTNSISNAQFLHGAKCHRSGQQRCRTPLPAQFCWIGLQRREAIASAAPPTPQWNPNPTSLTHRMWPPETLACSALSLLVLAESHSQPSGSSVSVVRLAPVSPQCHTRA